MKTPLEGKRILLTRPKEQFAEWADKLTELGAIPLSFPLIEISPLPNFEEAKALLSNIDAYKWIIFTSINAAKYFLEVIDKAKFPKTGISIAAVGSKTAAFLENHGLEVDFMPGIYTSAQLADSIPGIENKKILLPRTNITDDDLFERLTSRGASVHEIVVYHTQKISGPKSGLQQLVNEGLDIVTFASPSAVEAFCDMEINKRGVKIACIGPVTAEKAKNMGLYPDIIAEKYTTEGLTHAMKIFFESK